MKEATSSLPGSEPEEITEESPAARRAAERRAIAAAGQKFIDDWVQSDAFKRDQAAQVKAAERREAQAAALIKRKAAVYGHLTGTGGRPLTLGQRSHLKKLERLAAAAALAAPVIESPVGEEIEKEEKVCT